MSTVNLASRDLNLLVALRALLEESNVTRAGERLGVGQSSMSASLSRLRLHYGDELLVKVGRQFELTPLARNLRTEVQAAVPLIERALGIDDDFDASTSVRRFVIAGSDYGCLELHQALRALPDEAPGISIDYVPLPPSPADSSRTMSVCDFILAPPEFDIDARSEPLFVDRYVGILDPANPALENGDLSWEAFSELPHAILNLGASHRRPIDRRLAELGFDRDPTVLSEGLVSAGALIAGTEMVAVVPARLAARLAPLNGLIVVEHPFNEVELNESLWWQLAKQHDPGHRWLRELLLTHDWSSSAVRA